MLVTMNTQRFGFISLLLLASIARLAEAAVEPANEADARGLAQAFEKAVMSSDGAAVRAAFDIAALNRRALGKPADPEAAPAGRDIALASGAARRSPILSLSAGRKSSRGPAFGCCTCTMTATNNGPSFG